MSEPIPPEPGEALGAAREARNMLKAAVSAAEVAAASAAADPNWRDSLGRELMGLRDAFDDHVEEVEGEDGLLNQLIEDAPQLANQVNALEAEHSDLSRRIEHLLGLVRGQAEPAEIRDEVLDTLLAIARHRQRGADLVYQAYTIDIGTSD